MNGPEGLKTFSFIVKNDIKRVAKQIDSSHDVPESKLKLLLKVTMDKNAFECIKECKLIPTMSNSNKPINYPSNLLWKSTGELMKVSEVLPDKYSFVAGGFCYISKPEFSEFVRDNEPSNNDLLDQLIKLVTKVPNPDENFGEIFTKWH